MHPNNALAETYVESGDFEKAELGNKSFFPCVFLWSWVEMPLEITAHFTVKPQRITKS